MCTSANATTAKLADFTANELASALHVIDQSSDDLDADFAYSWAFVRKMILETAGEVRHLTDSIAS